MSLIPDRKRATGIIEEYFRRVGHQRVHQPGDHLILQAHYESTIYFLTAGLVQVFRTDEQGCSCLVEIRGGGELIGELGPLLGETRFATVTVVQPTVTWRVNAAEFLEAVTGDVTLSSAVLRMVAERVTQASITGIRASQVSSFRRVCALLVYLVDRFGVAADGAPGRAAGEGTITLDVVTSQQDLAGLAATSRHSVVRALARLRDDKIIATSRRQIDILDLAQLRHRADPAESV